MRGFRFGVNARGIKSREVLTRLCRDAEEHGYDVLLVPDHLGPNSPAPFPALVAIADVTERLRVGPFVLNVGFWNPYMLAREVATTDHLTGGRLELGLGAGHMKSEFDAAGIPWQPFGERIQRLASTIDELDRLFSDGLGGFDNRARPPLMIAGSGLRTLRLAAERADIVGHTGILQAPGKPPGTFRLGTAADMDERIRVFREHAGARAGDIESNILIQRVVVTENRRAAAEQLIAENRDELTVEEVLEAPCLLIGTVREIVEQVTERRERWGFSYICVHEPYLGEFGRIIEALRD
jgi:probable F420-dependent oxidoreductase